MAKITKKLSQILKKIDAKWSQTIISILKAYHCGLSTWNENESNKFVSQQPNLGFY